MGLYLKIVREETEEISRIWQMGLYNNHVNLDSFILDDDRVMFSAVVIKYKFLRVKISSTVTLY